MDKLKRIGESHAWADLRTDLSEGLADLSQLEVVRQRKVEGEDRIEILPREIEL